MSESRRTRRLRERLADAEHHKGFLHYPSHLARQDRKIARLRARLDRALHRDGANEEMESDE